MQFFSLKTGRGEITLFYYSNCYLRANLTAYSLNILYHSKFGTQVTE